MTYHVGTVTVSGGDGSNPLFMNPTVEALRGNPLLLFNFTAHIIYLGSPPLLLPSSRTTSSRSRPFIKNLFSGPIPARPWRIPIQKSDPSRDCPFLVGSGSNLPHQPPSSSVCLAVAYPHSAPIPLLPSNHDGPRRCHEPIG